MASKNFTRRDFIKTSTVAAAAGAVLLNAPKIIFGKGDSKTRVVLIRDAKMLDELNKPNADVVQKSLDKAVTTLLDVDDPVKAWKTLTQHEDTVGIKTNVWRYIPTTSEVEN